MDAKNSSSKKNDHSRNLDGSKNQNFWDIQQKVFTNWVNEQLKTVNVWVNDLEHDFSNGLKLIALVECLQKRTLKKNLFPNNQHLSRENVQIALNAISSDHIRLVNIGSDDIVSGNIRLILVLLWHLITRYQLNKSSTFPKSLILSWFEAALPEYKITNFTKDWNNGIVLSALIEFCKPNLIPNWKKLNPKLSLENCRKALALAKDEFGIPMILAPEDMCSSNLDEKSLLTYLSYFIKQDGSIYFLIMNWLKSILPNETITNLTTDWNSGLLMCKLLKELGAIIKFSELSSDRNFWENNWFIAFNASQSIELDPPKQLKEKHFTDPNIEYLTIMTYLTKLVHFSRKQNIIRIIGVNLNNVFVQQEAIFNLEILHTNLDLECIRSEVHSPSNKLVTSEITINKFGGQGKFIPIEPGVHELKIFYKDELSASLKIKVYPDLTNVIFSGIEPCSVGSLVEVVINSNGAGSSDVKVTAISSTNRELTCRLIEKDNSIIANFIPDEIGEWRIAITYSGEHINGSPFPCLVYDSSNVTVQYRTETFVNEKTQFFIDTQRSGWGKLDIDIEYWDTNKLSIPIFVDERGNGMYIVTFVPELEGKYLINVMFNKLKVKESPFTILASINRFNKLNINDNNFKANKQNLDIIANTIVSPVEQIAFLEIKNLNEIDLFSFCVKDPLKNELQCHLRNISDNVYKLEFKPTNVGRHMIYLYDDGQPVSRSPVVCSVYDINKVKVFLPEVDIFLDQEVSFEIDIAEAGFGNLEVFIDNGSTPCNLMPINKTRYSAQFKAKNFSSLIKVLFNDKVLPSSPFKISAIARIKQDDEKVIPLFDVSSFEVFKTSTPTSFDIKAKNSKIIKENFIVKIADSSNSLVPVKIVEKSDEVLSVYFSVKNIGNYLFEVFYQNNIMVHNFLAKAYDISKIFISDFPKKIIVGQKCNIQVDASNAGEGQLEISINDGEVPNQVQVLGNGKCLISFVPESVSSHIIDIKFNNENIIGCPFICEVIEFPEIKYDLSRIELVQVGFPVTFTINSSHTLDKKVFSVKVVSPNNILIPVNVTYGAVMFCDFIPTEVGPYTIDFEYCFRSMIEEPLIIKCFDPNKVIVNPTFSGCVGKAVQFIVDATFAGEGNLEISVLANGKNVSTQVQPFGGAKFGVSFTPSQITDHVVSICFNNVSINGDSFIVNILPSSDKPMVVGSALYYSPVDKVARLSVHNVESENEIIAKVQDGNSQIISANIFKDVQNSCIHLEFLPKMPGEYKIQLKYKGEHIQGSPFLTKIYDIAKIKIKDIPKETCLGKVVTFLVEATNAGPGNLEVVVNNGKVPSTPKSLGPSLYAISFVPTEPEDHVIEIKFNGENVESSPFRCKILDTEKVMIQRVEKVPINKVAQISINTMGGLLNVNSIIIFSPSHQSLQPILLGDHLNGYQVQFNPVEVGDHAIDIKIGGNSIPGCPFLVKVYDASKVKVTDIKNGFVDKPLYFTIDASMAGAGNLEIIVSASGRNVPNYVQSEGNAKFRVNFKPIDSTIHTISCKFNDESVPGSPFSVQIFEGNNAFGTLFSDFLLKNISLNHGLNFKIDNTIDKIENCRISVTTPSGKTISPTIEKFPDFFNVKLNPTEIGPHKIAIFMNDNLISSSPFISNVYDVNKIKISRLLNCVVGRPFTFLVDASEAGEGTLELVISTHKSTVKAEVLMKTRGFYDVTFLPEEVVTHFLNVTFNEDNVPGSPFKIEVNQSDEIDRTELLTAKANQIQSVYFKSNLNDLVAIITGPSKKKVDGAIIKMSENNYKIEYFPIEVGKYQAQVLSNEKKIWNKPVITEVFDPEKIQVTTVPDCLQGKEYEFLIDTNKAGEGTLDINVTCDGEKLLHMIKETKPKVYAVSFVPISANIHHIKIFYNKYPVLGSPFLIKVQAHLESIIIYGEGLKSAQCNEKTVFFIESRGICANEFDIIVMEPGRSPLPVKCYQQKNGCLLVEWTPKKIGSHKIEVFHDEKPVIGSPFICEIFDSSKIKIEPIDSSNFVINKKINLFLNRKHAGYAELDVTVTSPLGRHLPIEVKGTSDGEGELIEFVPTVPGKYKIAITYGNIEIPESPLKFVAQESILPKVSGYGLFRGIINKPCFFMIDAKDVYGSPEIKIDGPESETSFSIEKCNEIFKITYIPLEIGIFNIKILWNEQEIPESPFHPYIVDIEKIKFIGGGENFLDKDNKLNLCLGEEKKIFFDISEAGPGKLTAKIKHNQSFEDIFLDHSSSSKIKLEFKPKHCGEYEIFVYFENFVLPRMPIIVVVSDNISEGAIVVLRGQGLAGARVNEETEIIIDGKDAGDGVPEINLTGVKCDIKIKLQALGPRLYKALYIPQVPGTYLLNVFWNQKQVKGCPLKVPILPSCDAKRVICSGDGLNGGTVGKQIKAFIDTRRAGPGELSAYCIGPNKAAICELYDQSDGTFTLLIYPQECGKYTLTIKYGNQNVTGSPFIFKIHSAPDASKVKVIGPGIEHGVLPIFQSHFICDTRGAGAGQLTVRIRGPKGAFRVEMQRESQKERAIHCKYDPTEPGDYRIEVKWAGESVPGSPFFVMIFDTQDELNRFIRNGYNNSMISLPPLNAIERMNGPNYSEEWKQISWKGSTAEL